MVQYEDMKSRVKYRLVVGIITLSLGVGVSGCTPTSLDSIRPEINLDRRMVIFPENMPGFSELEEDDGSSSYEPPSSGIGGGGSMGDDGGGGASVVENASTYAELPYSVVCARDYGTYLQNQIYTPIMDALSKLDDTSRNQLYFRVFHSGYNLYSENPNQIVKASAFDNKSIGNVSYIGGTVFQNLAVDWLSTLYDNSASIQHRRSNWLSQLDNLDLDGDTTWLEASTNSSGLPAGLLMLWGNQRVGAETFDEYRAAVKQSVIGTMFNVSLTLKTAANSYSSIILNPSSGLSGSRFVDRMAKSSVDRLFGYYNQYETRSATATEFSMVDDHAAVFAFIDGYSKTIIAIGTGPDTTLPEILGDQYSIVTETVTSAKNNTEWSDISQYVENAEILQDGVRGLN